MSFFGSHQLFHTDQGEPQAAKISASAKTLLAVGLVLITSAMFLPG
ncbi:hypothetical protein [Shewanella waksmanii]|nr:hypothetical protein [Shewanella waksmanii]